MPMSAEELSRIILSGHDASVPDSTFLWPSTRKISAVLQSASLVKSAEPVKAQVQSAGIELSMWPSGTC